MKVTIKSITTPNIVEYIADFARVSRNRDEVETTQEQDLALCKKLWKDNERTAFECINIDFLIEGVSRSLLAQITRYRHATFMVKSQRYVKVKTDEEFIIPEFSKITFKDNETDNNSRAKMVVKNHCEASIRAYNELIRLGAITDDARSVMPNASTTRLRICCNLRSFMNFYQQRAIGGHASQEIERLAIEMFEKAFLEFKNPTDEDLMIYIRNSFNHTLKDLYNSLVRCGGPEQLEELIEEYEEFV